MLLLSDTYLLLGLQLRRRLVFPHPSAASDDFVKVLIAVGDVVPGLFGGTLANCRIHEGAVS